MFYSSLSCSQNKAPFTAPHAEKFASQLRTKYAKKYPILHDYNENRKQQVTHTDTYTQKKKTENS